jgi:exopolyphosphatase/guanosine-5'-triphosphate,3'-diphosphate pyrophosphatase
VRLSTLDIGTNTILALDARVDAGEGGELHREHDEMDIVRLGEGLDRSGRLSDAAMARALAVLARHGERLRAWAPDRVAAVATEAVRKAENGAEFLARATAALGHPVIAIDGQREAALSFLATVRSLPTPSAADAGPRVVVDIGGGSTEIIVGAGDRIARAVSLPIGSVRLAERLLHSDPPSEEERRALGAAIDAALDGFDWTDAHARALVGIAGTVTTILAIHLALPAYDAEAVHGRSMRPSEVEAIVERLGRLDGAARRRLPGLDPRRADVIYAGGAILSRVLARTGADELLVSDRGIRWGLAYELAAHA